MIHSNFVDKLEEDIEELKTQIEKLEGEKKALIESMVLVVRQLNKENK